MEQSMQGRSAGGSLERQRQNPVRAESGQGGELSRNVMPKSKWNLLPQKAVAAISRGRGHRPGSKLHCTS